MYCWVFIVKAQLLTCKWQRWWMNDMSIFMVFLLIKRLLLIIDIIYRFSPFFCVKSFGLELSRNLLTFSFTESGSMPLTILATPGSSFVPNMEEMKQWTCKKNRNIKQMWTNKKVFKITKRQQKFSYATHHVYKLNN